VGFDGYEVSDFGRVRSYRQRNGKPPRVLKPWLVKGTSLVGHCFVKLRCPTSPTGHRTVNVAHLVLTAFVGPRPAGLVACHANDDGSDNRRVNLSWNSRTWNVGDAIGNGHHNQSRKIKCCNGHDYDRANTRYVCAPSTGGRVWRKCAACQRDNRKRYEARRAAAAA
jgi:hypothetical protein